MALADSCAPVPARLPLTTQPQPPSPQHHIHYVVIAPRPWFGEVQFLPCDADIPLVLSRLEISLQPSLQAGSAPTAII
jgi:hypothetical protein